MWVKEERKDGAINSRNEINGGEGAGRIKTSGNAGTEGSIGHIIQLINVGIYLVIYIINYYNR